MSLAAGRGGRITRLAVGRHLGARTVRGRLTLLYGGLFLVSGAALMAVAYVLLVNAGFVFTLPNAAAPAPAARISGASTLTTPLRGFPGFGATTHPTAATLRHWRAVTECMRAHGIAGFPEPSSAVPASPTGIREISDRDGAILVIPLVVATQSRAFARAAATCGFADADRGLVLTDAQRRRTVRQQLLLQSGLALLAMSALSLGLGWLMAGRVMRPLEDAHEAQRRFVANASHELRAPLTRQRALIQVALDDPSATVSSLRHAHERVLAAELRLEGLIDGLLALSRGQGGLDRREPVDLAELMDDVVGARREQLAALDLELRVTLAAAPTAGDPRLLERLVANLIDNGVRHNTPGGSVTLVTGTRDRRAFLSVENTGQNIPADELDRLFEPFQRLNGARTGHDKGHGLGLSIVRAIAAVHGADVNACPRADGGLAIEISFPSLRAI